MLAEFTCASLVSRPIAGWLSGIETTCTHVYVFGASLSEPHTSESNGGIFIYIYIIYISVVHHSVNAS